MSVFAFVGRDRQIHLGDAANGRVWALTGSVPGNDRPWGALAARRDAWSWPTWSPDGAWIAFNASYEDAYDDWSAQLNVVSRDGGTAIPLAAANVTEFLCALEAEGVELSLEIAGKEIPVRLRIRVPQEPQVRP